MIAQVKLSCGVMYLQVAGIIVACEGTPCHCPRTEGNTWTVATLEQAARIINEEARLLL